MTALVVKKNPLRSTQKIRFSREANSKHGGFTAILTLKHSAFPLKTQAQKNTFFDTNENNRLGHTSARGGVYWEQKTYQDNRVLIAIPEHLDTHQEMTLILFLHGNQMLLARDLVVRNKIAQQLFASQANAILVAPQLAKDALDSSPGNFALENFAQDFLTEATKKISSIHSNKILKAMISRAKVVLVAYSGGYLTAAKILAAGNISQRIKGIILLDALYGEADTFADFISLRSKQVFLFSCFTEPAREENNKFKNLVSNQGFRIHTELPRKLKAGCISVVKLSDGISHWDLLKKSWTKNTLTDLFSRI